MATKCPKCGFGTCLYPADCHWQKPLDPAVQAAIDEKERRDQLGNVTQWNGGWSIMGEVPPEAGKLVASTVFHGMLFLAFEGGLWCVMGGKLRKVTIDNG